MSNQVGMKKIASAGIGYIFGGILIKGIAFITTPVFSRLMTTKEFGVLNAYLSYESILAVLIGFQFAGCLKNAKIKYANMPNGINAFFSDLIVLLLIHSGISFVIVNAFSNYIIALTGIESRLLLNLIIVNSFGNAAMTVYNSFVSLEYQYKKYVAISVFNALANVALSLLLIFTVLSNDRSMARILGYVLPYVLISIYLVVTVFRKSRPNLHTIKTNSKFAYRFCAPLIPNGFAEIMLTQYSKLAVDRYCGTAAMGVYSLAYNVYSIIATVKLGMDYIVGPFYFDKRSSGNFVELRNIFKIYSRSLALISVVVMLFTPEIVKILGDTTYYDARMSAIPLIAVSYFSFLCYMLSQEEYFEQKTYIISGISICAMLLNILFCNITVSKFEAIGVAYCTLASFVVMFLLHFVVIKYFLKSQSFQWSGMFADGIFVTLMSIVAELIVDKLMYRIGIITLLMAVLAVFVCRNFRHIIKIRK